MRLCDFIPRRAKGGLALGLQTREFGAVAIGSSWFPLGPETAASTIRDMCPIFMLTRSARTKMTTPAILAGVMVNWSAVMDAIIPSTSYA